GEAALSQAFVDGVADLLASVGIPRSLRELGLASDKQGFVAEASLNSARLIKNNPRPLDLAAMQKITAAAFSGDRAALVDA
ncbi:MAG: iron-containing alcohol dehydrogenase, partial [Caulobacteraceae bacterium]